MQSTTVSFRVPQHIYQELSELALILDLNRSDMMRRFIIAGVEGLKEYKTSGQHFDWPRSGRIKMHIAPPSSLSETEERDILLSKLEEIVGSDFVKGLPE